MTEYDGDAINRTSHNGRRGELTVQFGPNAGRISIEIREKY